MKVFTFTQNKIVIGSLTWWTVFVVLSIFQINQFQILNVVGFLALTIVPGLLTVTSMRLRGLTFWGYIGMVTCFSLFELMIVGLISNTLLPHIGVTRPLDPIPILEEVSVLVTILAVICYKRAKHFEIPSLEIIGLRDRILTFLPSVFVVMSVFGAIRLNNGGSGIITLFMLIAIAVYIAVLAYYAEKVGEDVIPTALFFISLALLFMTSLRGWFTTGHDILKEFYVFELVKANGIWSVAFYQDAYNACMSITILPTIFSNLLKVADPYVYKVFFQTLFAIVPQILYLIVRKYVPATIAFLATVYFIAFPTFFGDMPFLNRQEIAFLFLVTMIYATFSDRFTPWLQQMLLLIFGVGIILSHYSTNYSILGVLVFLLVMRPTVFLIERHISKVGFFKSILSNSGYVIFKQDTVEKKYVTFSVVLVLMITTFLWTNVLTNTASNSIVHVLSDTAQAMLSNARGYNRSGDVAYGILSYQKLTPYELFQSYLSQVVTPARALSPQSYYNVTSYQKYNIGVVPQDVLPLTPVGEFLNSHLFNVSNFNSLVRQSSAKFLQIFIVIGFVCVLFTSRFLRRNLETEFVLMSAGSLVLLAALIVLPVLSVEYGALRAFQQSLIFLSAFLVIGLLTPVSMFNKKTQYFFASFVTIIFFLSITGVFTQILGGYDPQLHLNNDGTYYDIYYVRGGEIDAALWLSTTVAQNASLGSQGNQSSTYQTDLYTRLRTLSFLQNNSANDIYPGLIKKTAYVFLGYTDIHKQEVNLFYNSTLITYNFPLEFLDNYKDLVYSNKDARIYR